MNALDDLFDEAERTATRLVVYRRDESETLDQSFPARGVGVTSRPLPTEGPPAFVAITNADGFAGVLSLADLEELLSPPVVRPADPASLSPGYRALFDALDDTLFTSLRRPALLAVSREIEDRAFRVGSGTLRANFQTAAVLADRRDAYRRLADATDLDVHVYAPRDGVDGDADGRSGGIDGVNVHLADPDLAPYWVVAYDGDGVDQQCALVARERDDGYLGCWTNDPERVARVLDGLADADG